MSVVLASNSPRRRELLSLTGWSFVSLPANIDESPLTGEEPDSYVLRLATQKAKACDVNDKSIILAADTVVVDGNQLLGKPANPAEARRMLVQLRGRDHRVMTALTLFETGSGQMESELCVSTVPMRNYADREMDDYIQSNDPLDKAGAYAIQHPGFHPVEGFHGCFASVMGLPLCHLKRMAAGFGLPVSPDMVHNCERLNRYACPIFDQVAQGVDIG